MTMPTSWPAPGCGPGTDALPADLGHPAVAEIAVEQPLADRSRTSPDNICDLDSCR
ncbi:hypothetical protein HRW18_04725 [Streptomyces lunaelactis]|uniref:hypothetical protein n=1 Tax=Streptomyces lunaelactis TaxID=1535768 RepID=UPI0015849455|nr:hypothetical protein [Streptomyces lunaelactis]NUK00513.1 hypothetical protein [Streptomyces lunaelactis]NUK07330.1 hypothetical protein [Streptomyces lunaelactis]NUK15717.1 hypothetical protein [Streptomyces lunaelactis]NUK22317.1 hypothetical protein [Streptomyces lunaelactis]NUL08687.1 hypothetical protein [Streptomyces lunaelactis]